MGKGGKISPLTSKRTPKNPSQIRVDDDLSDITCNKDLVVENEILKVKLEEADKENSFLRGEYKDLTVLLNAKIQTSFYNFKIFYKRMLVTRKL